MGRGKAKAKGTAPKAPDKIKEWAKAESGEWGYVEIAPDATPDPGFRLEADLTAEELAEIAAQFKPKEGELPELKKCPACGGKAEVKLDIHSLWRCFCQTCGFWDCGAHVTQLSAAESWNGAGGPNPVDD